MSDVFHHGPVRRVRLRYFPVSVLVVAALGLWLMPGLAGRPGVALIRLGVSLGLLAAAVGAYSALRR
ncbi:hypothetical protein [Tropicibacter alexandrii]|uniref:hypothetical protein n=1 Tax=Tropicibacter alexandrii TaxID=2267683 RepID=UPI000EF4442D|nr:hypothetical protein [Tropicibacter alexandrii]